MIRSVSMSFPGTWTARPAMRVIFSSAMDGVGALASVRADAEHLAGVGHRASDGGGRHHDGAHEYRAPGGAPLPALEVAVGRARADLVSDKLVRVHRQAHGAA